MIEVDKGDTTCNPCMGSGGSGLNAICHHCFGDGKAKTFRERFNHIRNHSSMPLKALSPEMRGPMHMFTSLTILVKELLDAYEYEPDVSDYALPRRAYELIADLLLSVENLDHESKTHSRLAEKARRYLEACDGD
jgi:hypothetical protein